MTVVAAGFNIGFAARTCTYIGLEGLKQLRTVANKCGTNRDKLGVGIPFTL